MKPSNISNFVSSLFFCVACLAGPGARAQCTVAIPPNAIVVDTTLGSAGVGKFFWICPHDTLTGSGVEMTYFMEQGSSFSGSGIDKNVYMKTLSSISGSGIDDSIWHEANTNISISSPFTMLCPTLVFDYTDAPTPGCPVATGLPSSERIVHVRIYPNPAHDFAVIEPGEAGTEVTGVTVFAMNGQEAKPGKERRPGRLRLDLSGLAAGAYTVRIRTTQGTAVHFLTVE